MADTVWEGFLETISSEEKVLPKSWYKVNTESARPFVKGGEVQRGIFVDYVVLEGPQKNAFASVYIGIPEPGNRKQGFWYQKKMAGYGDLTSVYENMPDDLEGGLEFLCAAIQGKQVFAEIGPGVGDFSNRNSLGGTKPTDEQVPTSETVDTPAVSANGEVNTESTAGAADTSSAPSDDDDDPGF